MAIVDNKKKVFGKIAAYKTLTQGLPTLKLSSSFSSVNNNGDVISFLTDLVKSLIGFEALVSTVVDTISSALPKIELSVKKALKIELKNIVSCGVDPSLPSWIKSTGNGITIEINKFDFVNILKIDPTSIGGSLIYNDITNPFTNSNDFNTFLYGVIQNQGIPQTWKNIMTFTFNEIGVGQTPNNTLNIKAHPQYDNKTLTDLNNDFIDSLTLFNSENIITTLMDIIYGSVSSNVGKTMTQLENEAKLNTIIDKMVNNVNQGTLNDSAFAFSNDEIYQQQLDAARRKQGFNILKTSNDIQSTVPIDYLTTLNTQIAATTSLEQKRQVISDNLNNMANISSVNVPNNIDIQTTKLNFIQELISNLIKSIVNILLSPKIILLFLINYKIIYGPSAIYSDNLDFIKKNKNLINSIIKVIAEEIIKILLALALKEISLLVTQAIAKKQKEKNFNRLAQLQSLVGIPPNIIRNLLDSLI